MKLIVGLGNPGTKYESTRHNVGFRVVRAWHAMHALDFDGWKNKFQGLVSEGRIGNEKIALLLPQTYMNESGRAVREAVDFWKIEPTDIILVSDDFSLPLGKLRLRREGSAGGHNGLKSIFVLLGTEEIPRLRLGIGNELLEHLPAEKFVLEPFAENELEPLIATLRSAVEALNIILMEGLEEAMNRYN
ncbi:aminoacyl-tRNA hydrolase [Patescibacteria group bacterium]|nr:aminoacyl-tRNA hydrolase [Patescibacteria group bacterium]MBU1028968.1 aminoacyl-tRNA hydrolase [Patescibacteria group bacterium]MBU1916439.1 aminoacyl-tRNA hydrolase [Patescibacteria group bacterium]